MNFRSLPLGSPGHHCLQPPHSVEKRHCFYIPTLARGSIFSSFFFALVFPSAWHCVVPRSCLFRCRREILAAQEAGTLRRRPSVGTHVFFSCDISAVAPVILSFTSFSVFLVCNLTSQCGASRSSDVLQDFSLVCSLRTDKRSFLDLKVVAFFLGVDGNLRFFPVGLQIVLLVSVLSLRTFHVFCLTVFSGCTWPHSKLHGLLACLWTVPFFVSTTPNHVLDMFPLSLFGGVCVSMQCHNTAWLGQK